MTRRGYARPSCVRRLPFAARGERPAAVENRAARLSGIGSKTDDTGLFIDDDRRAATRARLRRGSESCYRLSSRGNGRAFAGTGHQLVTTGSQVIYAQGPYASRAAPGDQRNHPHCRLRSRERSGCGRVRRESRATRRQRHRSLPRSVRISAKQLQLLMELVPGLTRVAVLYDAAVASAQRDSVEGAATRLGVTIAPIVWSGPDRLPAALQSATQDAARGLIVLSSPHIHEQGNRRLVADAALKRRLPAIGMLNFARDGLLITYGPVQKDMLRSAAAWSPDSGRRPACGSSHRATPPL